MSRTLENPKTLQSRIVSGSMILLSGSTMATAINLAYNFAVARFLGPNGFGHATAVYTLLTLVSAVTLSFQLVSAKSVAQQESKPNQDAAYRNFHRAAWGCGISVALGLMLFQRGIANYLHLPSSFLVMILAVGAMFYVPLGSRRGYIQGAYGFGRLATSLVLEGAVRLVGSVVMILLGYGVMGVIAANSAAIAIAYFAIAPKLTPPVPNPLFVGSAFREIVQALVFFSGQVLINNSDIVLVKHFFTPSAAGLYAVVAMVGRVVFAFSSAVVNSMIPVVAGTRHVERKNLSLVTTSLLLVLTIGAVLAIGLRLTPAWVWSKFFGNGFAISGPHGLPYLLALYAMTSVIYSLTVVIITYEMSYKIANTSWLQLLFGGLFIAGICQFHHSLQQVIMVQLILTVALLLLVAVPFLVDALRNRESIPGGAQSVRLLRRISEEQVIAEFLKSDFENNAYSDYRESLRSLVLQPNLADKSECAKRRALLFLRHRSLWKELPLGTEWFEAEVRADELDQIRVFPRAHWLGIARGNFAITKVVERTRKWQAEASSNSFTTKIDSIRSRLSEQGSMPGSILLIGLDDMQPLTILDGNHRFVAAIMEGKVDQIRFICGLSPKMRQCCWYRTNLFTLSRYTRNLLRHLPRHPEAELQRLFETQNSLT